MTSDDTRAEGPVATAPRDPAEFAAVYELMYADVHAYLRHHFDEDTAHDVAAETFLRAFRFWQHIDPDRAKVRSWLRSIARNVAAASRPDRRERLGVPPMGAGALVPPAHVREYAQRLRGDLADALAELSPSERDALLLHAFCGWSEADIAAALGTSEATARARLSRARRNVRLRLGPGPWHVDEGEA